MKIKQFLLWPFVPLYALAIKLWRWLYKAGVWGQAKFSVPVISVGNLQAGGTGKTPMVAWLAEHLNATQRTGILSRGYKRLTFGFRMANSGDTYREIGDEPSWLRNKLPESAVAVAENRIEGIPNLLSMRPDVSVIILDDGYQQLGIKVSLNILMTPYHRPFTKDMLLPAGNLREPIEEQERADLIVVSYCPEEKLSHPKQMMRELGIELLPHQKIFLSSSRFGTPYHLFYEGDFKNLRRGQKVLLITGIADPHPTLQFLASRGIEVFHLKYRDHHRFVASDIEQFKLNYQKIAADQEPVILTTEKDAVRLLPLRKEIADKGLEIYVQPMYLCWGERESELIQMIHQALDRR